jgi:hypothetical protein
MYKKNDFYLNSIFIVCILGFAVYLFAHYETENKFNFISLAYEEFCECTGNVKLGPKNIKSKLYEIPDYQRKDEIERIIGADVLRYSGFLILVISNVLLYYKKKSYGYMILLIFSVFQGITISLLISIFIFTEFLIDWSLRYCFEYLLMGLIFGFLTFFIGILLIKIFELCKIVYIRNKTYFSYNNIIHIFNCDFIPILKPILFIYAICKCLIQH